MDLLSFREEKMQKAFQMIDINGDGSLDKDDIFNVLVINTVDELEMREQLQINEDGAIQYKQLLSYINL